MKKAKSISLILSLSFLASCQNQTISQKKTQTDNSQSKTNDTLIVYFSCTGTTEKIAKKIKDITSYDQFEIVPKKEYTAEDLNYNDSNSRANKEQNDSTSRPEIMDSTIDLSSYQSFIVGYPIWWGKLPKILYTFFDTYDFKDRNIHPFCTSASSGIAASVEEIKALEPEANVTSGKRFSQNTEDEDIKSWLNTL